MNIYKLFLPQELSIEVTGTSGTATIAIDGATYTVTFNTNLNTTAADFVTAEAANILAAHNIVVTNPGSPSADLLFKKADQAEFTISIANATGDLDGTESGAVATIKAECTTDGIAAGGNITIHQIATKNVGQFIDDVAILGDYEVLKRDVKSESDLIDYATDNSLGLIRTNNNGGDSSVLVSA